MTTIKIKDNKTGGYQVIKMKADDMYSVIGVNAAGKLVLDVGCADIDCEKSLSIAGAFYLHEFISSKAKHCVGVDHNEAQVAKLNKLGYDCICANAENLDLSKKFEVIVASNLIEHLSNVGQFLESAKRHLERNGILIITTPNPFFLWRFVEIIFKGNFAINEDHTCWFDPKTLGYSLLQHGFHIKEMYWTTSYWIRPRSLLVRLARAIRGYFSSGITVVATLSDSE